MALFGSGNGRKSASPKLDLERFRGYLAPRKSRNRRGLGRLFFSMKPPPGPRGASTNPSLKHPGRWLWLLLLVPVALGLTRLRFDVEVFDLLPPSLPAVEGLKLYQEHFANARELIITVQAQSA